MAARRIDFGRGPAVIPASALGRADRRASLRRSDGVFVYRDDEPDLAAALEAWADVLLAMAELRRAGGSVADVEGPEGSENAGSES